MISHGLPDEIVGKSEIAHDEQFLLFQQLFNPAMIKLLACLNWEYLQKSSSLDTELFSVMIGWKT